jgi:nucleoside-diphosphate-sugar epimerase
MKIGISGGGGKIGRKLVQEFAKFDIDVIEINSVKDFESGSNLDLFINAAGKTEGSINELIESNVTYPNSLAKKCLEFEITFIQIGSLLELDSNDSIYANSKRICSSQLQSLSNKGLRLNLIFLGTTYGDFTKPSIIERCINGYKTQNKFTLIEPSSLRDFIHIDDAINIIAKHILLFKQPSPDIFVCSGKLYKISEIYNYIFEYQLDRKLNFSDNSILVENPHDRSNFIKHIFSDSNIDLEEWIISNLIF